MAKYIDADRLIETLNKEKVPFSEDVNYFIINAPAADVAEVRHGRWLKDYTPHEPYCSVCDYRTSNLTNYCPNCGALMDEVEK